MPSLKELAELAGVSKSTVSRALRNDPSISEATRKRILQLAKEKGHTTNRLAQALASRRSFTIGVVPNVANLWFRDFCWTLGTRLFKKGYVLINAYLPPFQEAQYMSEMKIDGIVLWGDAFIRNLTPEQIEKMAAIIGNTPTVAIGADLRIGSVPYVEVDRNLAFQEAVKYLFELGHRRIAYLGRVDRMQGTAPQKISGYLSAVTELGLPSITVDTPLTQHDAAEAVPQVMEHGPTAVIAESAEVAFGFTAGCWRYSVRIPEEISLIGYDNMFEGDGFTNTITTFGPDLNEMARLVTELLLNEVDRKRRSSKQRETSGSDPSLDQEEVTFVPIRWQIKSSAAPPAHPDTSRNHGAS